MEDLLSTNTRLKDEIHGLYFVFRRASDKIGEQVPPGVMRTRAESFMPETSGSKPNLDSDEIKYINASISMDEDLQKIDQDNILMTVKQYKDSEGKKLSTQQMDKALNKIKEKAILKTQPVVKLEDMQKTLKDIQTKKT